MANMSDGSVLRQIQNAALSYCSANTQKLKAIGELYKVYRKAIEDEEIASEINLDFDQLVVSKRPNKCKSLAGKIAWIAFSQSKQRVSDTKKLLEFADSQGTAPNEFVTLLEQHGEELGSLPWKLHHRKRCSSNLIL